MSQPSMASTTCKGCGRVVYVRDVDAAGRCCFCQQPTPDKKKPLEPLK